mgnify:CR=1 FL=1
MVHLRSNRPRKGILVPYSGVGQYRTRPSTGAHHRPLTTKRTLALAVSDDFGTLVEVSELILPQPFADARAAKPLSNASAASAVIANTPGDFYSSELPCPLPYLNSTDKSSARVPVATAASVQEPKPPALAHLGHVKTCATARATTIALGSNRYERRLVQDLRAALSFGLLAGGSR